MTLYAETSAVVSWLLGEPSANAAWRALRQAGKIFTSDLTLIECHRVLHRLTATGHLQVGDAAAVRSRLERCTEYWTIHRISPRVAERSQSGFPREPVRSLDAIHLATALLLRNVCPDLRILSLDRRIRANAAALDFVLEPRQARRV